MGRVSGLLLSAVCSVFVLAACAPASTLRVPGDIARPPFSGPLPAGPPRAAVADFAYAAAQEAPDVIGRDYDRVRKVVWEGNPGATMADLVAGALSERGVATVRVKAGDPVPVDIPVLVTGSVRRFELNVRRGGMLKVSSEAFVALSVTASGSGMSAPYETSVASSTTMEDLIAVPQNLRKALVTAATSAADEAARRLGESEAGAAFPAGGKGGGGTPR